MRILGYTSFDVPTEGFTPVDIDFHDRENEYFVRRYYNRRLAEYLSTFPNIVVTQSDITKDVEVWELNQEKKGSVTYKGKRHALMVMDRYTLRVKNDPINKTPYMLVANNRPALLLNVPLSELFDHEAEDPLHADNHITPSMINLVMTRREHHEKDGKSYVTRKIDKYEYLKKHQKYCPAETTRPIMNGQLRRFFGLDNRPEQHSFESKYIKYKNKIDAFRRKYLSDQKIKEIFPNLAPAFTTVQPSQIGQTDSSKRKLVFGKTSENEYYKAERQQYGVNYGPRISCPYTDVRLIGIYHESEKERASRLLSYIKNGHYQSEVESQRKRLSKYIGTTVSYADSALHIELHNKSNPVEEVNKALNSEAYRSLDPKVKYVGIYLSPIHKYGSDKTSKECYYKIKELFLKRGIVTQVIDDEKMNDQLTYDKSHNTKNFIYTLQNMGVAICAKLGGSPWLIDETPKKELIIGIGAFKSDNHQYIGAAFSFDNTGAFNDYSYFQESELDALVGAIEMKIIAYSKLNDKPQRLIIHYYKKISRKKEFQKIEDMLRQLNLDIPVYVVTINKTESRDVVVFDEDNKDLMPYSGTWVNLGPTQNGYRYLLCNNTRYENGKFKPMDGFPFPVKLTITCSKHNEIPAPVIQELIDQVYQFSRIYWKSVKQQALPVTIKYPEMIAEIMPHFNDLTVYIDKKCLWFL